MESLISYLPTDRQYALLNGTDLPARGGGSAVFADISGFTPLTEALARALGPQRGAEELTRQLNRVYDALIMAVDRYGGSVVSFSGDAITCWFAAADATADAAAARRAVTCALALQRVIATFGAVEVPGSGTSVLALKVAVTSGHVQRFLAGDPHIQVIETLAGDTILRLATAEHLAHSGEIISDSATARLLQPDLIIAEWRTAATGEQFCCLQALTAVAPPAAWPVMPTQPLLPHQIRPWLLPAIYERLHAELGEFLTELRPVAVVFVLFGGIDYERDDQAQDNLDTFIRHLQRIIARYDGNLLQLTIGDKGSYVYIAFGAPTAHEDDPRRAVLTAAELQHLHQQLDFLHPLQIGVSQGVLRTGAYGSTTRRTYSALGDAVNLAARLMQAASPGAVLASESIYSVTADLFNWQHLPPLQIKGKRDALIVARLDGVIASAERPTMSYQHDLVGRERELAMLHGWLNPIFNGASAGLIAVYGEAGMGKSHLVHQVQQHLSHQHALHWWTWPTDELLHQALHPVRHFLRTYCGQRPDASSAANAAAFARTIEQLSATLPPEVGELGAELQRTRSFLAALIDLHQAGSLYEQVEPKLRFDNTIAAITTLLRAASYQRPVVLHIEDAQWVDADTLTLIQTLLTELADRPFVVLLASRAPLDDRFALINGATSRQHLRLRGLNLEAICAVASQMLGGDIDAHLALLLADKTEGNPFFAEQLILDLRERDALQRNADGEWSLASTEDAVVPANISTVLIARLDRLTVQIKAIVQTAAVLGNEFEVRVLAQMLRHDTRLNDKLQRAVEESIWTTINQLRYLFRHALLRDAAYAMQVQERLRELHRQAGEAIEQVYSDDLAPYAADLVYHFHYANDHGRERHYAQLAGERAAVQFANADALHYFSRALELTPADDAASHYRLLLAREQIFDLQGDREAQQRDLDMLADLAEHLSDDQRRVEIGLRRANLALARSDFDAAVATAQHAVDLATTIAGTDQIAAGLLLCGEALGRQGNYATARDYIERALAQAQSIDQPNLAARSLSELGTIAGWQGAYADAHTFYTQALAMFQQLGNRKREGVVLSNLGWLTSLQGEYAAAEAWFNRALAIARSIGDRQRESNVLGNLGWLARSQGDDAAAQQLYQQVQSINNAIGDRQGACWALIELGAINQGQGNYATAHEYFTRAYAVAEAMNDRQYESYILHNLGAIAHYQHDHATALVQSQQAFDIAEAIGDARAQGFALTMIGHALGGLERWDAAAQTYAHAYERWQNQGDAVLALEPLAGLAQAALAQHDLAQALEYVEQILAHGQTGTLDGTDEPLRIEWTCYAVLRAADDQRATQVLETAYAHLQTRVAAIADGKRRAMLLNIPHHRAIVEAWERHGSEAI